MATASTDGSAAVPAVGTPVEADGAAAREVAVEQAHLDVALTVLERLRTEALAAERSAVRGAGSSTPQATYERDVALAAATNRRADLDAAAYELVFGRLDREDGEVLRVGRIGVRTPDAEPLIVDWRAAAAAAFYRATPAQPEGVLRRRTITCRGTRVQGVEDDLLQPDRAGELGATVVVGDGAFLSALARERGRHMRDIVATIQREQDEAVRAPADGALLVTGGPGTGKTAVALHRVAYLMYAQRDRYARRGVLVVGPSPVFVQYVSRVLPALGETSARLASLGTLLPDAAPTAVDDPAVAAVKGSTRMAAVLARAVRSAGRRELLPLRVSVRGITVEVPVGDQRRRLDALRRGSRSHNGQLVPARRALADLVWRRWAAETGARDWSSRRQEEARDDVHDALSDDVAFLRSLDRFWPVLSPRTVLEDLRAGRLPLRSVAGDVLRPDEQRLLTDAWRAADGLSVADVALLDELDEVVGRPPEPELEMNDDDVFDAVHAEAYGESGEVTTFADRTARRRRDVADELEHRDHAHVVVDEAQDVSPMQWRMLGRRGRSATWTIVGDWAQSAWADADESRAAMREAVGVRRPVHEHRLTTNYRTSTEIATLAARVLRRVDPTVEPPRAVREAGVDPVVTTGVADVVAAAVAAAADLLDEVGGTVGVVAPRRLLPALRDALPDPTVGGERLVLLDPWEAKGLEFDGCLVVAPEEIESGSPTGLRELYVAVTRATQRLVVVTASHDLGALAG